LPYCNPAKKSATCSHLDIPPSRNNAMCEQFRFIYCLYCSFRSTPKRKKFAYCTVEHCFT
jgi:hypothetical protein